MERTETKQFAGKLRHKDISSSTKPTFSSLLFDLLCYLDPQKVKNKQTSQRSEFIRSCLPLIYIAGNQLAYLPLKKPGVFTGTARVWEWVMWIRADYVAGEMGQQVNLLYAVWGLIGGLSLLILYCILSLYCCKSPPQRLTHLFTFSSSLLFSIFPVPILGLLVSDLLSFLDPSPSGLDSQPPSLTSAASGVCLVLFSIIYVIRGIAGVEVLCHPKFWSYSARTDVIETGIDLFSLVGTAGGYFIAAPLNGYIFYLIFALTNAVCGLFYYFRLPLYSETGNLLRVSFYLFLSWSGFSMLLGRALDSDFASVMLILVVSPVILCALQSSWHMVYVNTLESYFEDVLLVQERYGVYLITRAAIMTGVNETVITAFRSLRVTSETKLDCISLLESNYTLQLHGNESLARYQLSRSSRKHASFIDSFLKHKMWKRLDRSSDLEEVNYLKFLDGLSKVQHTDESLCRHLSEFWSEVASHDPKLPKINTLVDRICLQVKQSKRLYSNLLATSPENPILLDCYSTFLRDILLKTDKATMWETKTRIIKEAQQRSIAENEVSFSHSETGVILIDLSTQDVGKIIYFNALAASLLQYDPISLAAVKLFALVPQPYAGYHAKNMIRFEALRDTTNINHPQLMPLVTSRGFVTEFITRFSVTSVGGPAILLFGFRQSSSKRELALVSHEGLIYAHSERFPLLLSASSASLVSQCIFSYCPELAVIGDQTILIRSDPPVFAAACSVPYQSKFVRKVLLYTSQESCLHFTTLKETRRRSKLVLMRNLSTSDLGKFSSAVSSKIPDKGDSAFLATPHMMALTSLTKDLRVKRIDGIIDSFDKRLGITSVSRSNGVLFKSTLKLGLARVFNSLSSVTSLVILLLLAWNIAITIYLITVTHELIDNSISIQLSERIVHTTRIAGQGRFLDLTNAGFFPEYMTSDVKNVISQSVSLLSSIEELLWSRLKSFPDGPFKSMYVSDVVKTWELSHDTVHPHDRNLINAMQVYIDHSRVILQTPIEELSVRNPSVYFVVQNGMKGEVIKALTRSLEMFKEMERKDIEENVSRIMYLVISVFFTLGLALVISVPVLTRLQYYILQVSDVFTQLSLAKCLEIKRRVVDRLRDQYDVEIEYGVDKPKKKMERISLYRPVWMLVALVIGFFCACVLLYLVLYFKNIASLVIYVSQLPEVMQYYALRFTGLIDLWTWTMEAIFMDSAWPLTVAMPDYSLQMNPLQCLAVTYGYLKIANKKLFEMAQAGYLPLTNEHMDLFLHSSNYTTLMLKKGLRIGMVAYSGDIHLCSGYRGVSDEMYADCGNLYSAAREFVNVSSDVLRIIQEDFQLEVITRSWEINYWLFAWTSFGFLFLALSLLPLIFHSRLHIQRLIAIASLIPCDSYIPTDLKKTMTQTIVRDTTVIGNKHG